MTFPDPIKHKIYVSPNSQSLINSLLEKDKSKRLGAKGGVQEILDHPFFDGLDIEKLLKKELTPEYMPDINQGELKYFD